MILFDQLGISVSNSPSQQNTVFFLLFAAAKGKGKGMVKEEMKGPEICKDPVRLTSYAVGVNILKQGEDPQLKPPEQYPEWYGHVLLKHNFTHTICKSIFCLNYVVEND